MGVSGSKDCAEMVTPPKSAGQRRVLEFDPRSPSAAISRTPIVVEKIPEGLIDPRSPTVGILRTPIASNGNYKK